MRRGRGWLATSAFACVATMVAAVASPAAARGRVIQVEPARTGAVDWYLSSVDSPHSITISTGSGWCVGDPRPSLRAPRVEWLRGAVVITARLHTPRRVWRSGEACGGVGLGMSEQIHLSRSIAARAIYDGSASPPEWRGGLPVPFGLRKPLLALERTLRTAFALRRALG